MRERVKRGEGEKREVRRREVRRSEMEGCRRGGWGKGESKGRGEGGEVVELILQRLGVDYNDYTQGGGGLKGRT